MLSVSWHDPARLLFKIVRPLLFSQIQTVTAPQGVSQSATQERWKCPACGKANTGFRETCGSCNRPNPIAPANKETERKVGVGPPFGTIAWSVTVSTVEFCLANSGLLCNLQDILKCTPDEILALAIQKMHPSLDSAFREAGMPVEQTSAVSGNNLSVTGERSDTAEGLCCVWFCNCQLRYEKALLTCPISVNIFAVLCWCQGAVI